ncbi:18292_t:CDS:1, partial [Racocetra persica]
MHESIRQELEENRVMISNRTQTIYDKFTANNNITAIWNWDS